MHHNYMSMISKGSNYRKDVCKHRLDDPKLQIKPPINVTSQSISGWRFTYILPILSLYFIIKYDILRTI
jgi:hypothetical protein